MNGNDLAQRIAQCTPSEQEILQNLLRQFLPVVVDGTTKAVVVLYDGRMFAAGYNVDEFEAQSLLQAAAARCAANQIPTTDTLQ